MYQITVGAFRTYGIVFITSKTGSLRSRHTFIADSDGVIQAMENTAEDSRPQTIYQINVGDFHTDCIVFTALTTGIAVNKPCQIRLIVPCGQAVRAAILRQLLRVAASLLQHPPDPCDAAEVLRQHAAIPRVCIIPVRMPRRRKERQRLKGYQGTTNRLCRGIVPCLLAHQGDRRTVSEQDHTSPYTLQGVHCFKDRDSRDSSYLVNQRESRPRLYIANDGVLRNVLQRASLFCHLDAPVQHKPVVLHEVPATQCTHQKPRRQNRHLEEGISLLSHTFRP